MPGMRQSTLAHILKGIDKFKEARDGEKITTKPLTLGTAVHLIVLQPHLAHLVVEAPEKKSQKKVDLEEYEEALKQLDGKLILSLKDYDKAHFMAESVRKNSDSKWILDQCTEFEKVCAYTYKDIDFKCSIDAWNPAMMADLKTTSADGSWALYNSIETYNYDFQAASYMKTNPFMSSDDYFFIFVNSYAPFTVYPRRLRKSTFIRGFEKFDRACDIYNDCFFNNPEFIVDNRLEAI